MPSRGRRFWVEAWRGDRVESRHEIACAAFDVDVDVGSRVADDPYAYWRSAAKPFQLLPLVVAGGCERFDLDAADLAVMSASHDGTEAHAARVEAILGRFGLGAGDLRCGTHRPYFLESLPAEDPRRLKLYSPLHNNCSGNHAAMLALARLCGVEAARYLETDSRGQTRIAAAVEALCGVPPHVATDDCGAPCYGMPLSHMAQAYRFLARPDAVEELPAERRRLLQEWAPLERVVAALERIAAALAREPAWVSGESTAWTRLARAFMGELVLKTGAEGVLCVAHRRRRAALAFKVRDGHSRVLVPALVHVLDEVGWLPVEASASLRDLAEPVLHGRLGQVVGRLRVVPG